MIEPQTPTEPTAIVALADLVANRRIELEKVNDLQKEAQAAYDEVEARLFDVLEATGLQQIRTERGLFRLNDLAWASVTDEAAARDWAEHNEPALLLLNRQRLSVIVRQVLKGEESAPGLEPGQMPPGVDYRTSRKITWRRS